MIKKVVLCLILLLLIAGCKEMDKEGVFFEKKSAEGITGEPSEIQKPTQTDNRIISEAAKEKDESICNQIEDQSSVQTCKDRVRLNKAMVEGELSACAAISDAVTKQDCEQTILMSDAISKQDTSLCDQLINAESGQKCRDDITYVKAMSTKDKSLCKEIADDELRFICEEKF